MNLFKSGLFPFLNFGNYVCRYKTTQNEQPHPYRFFPLHDAHGYDDANAFAHEQITGSFCICVHALPFNFIHHLGVTFHISANPLMMFHF